MEGTEEGWYCWQDYDLEKVFCVPYDLRITSPKEVCVNYRVDDAREQSFPTSVWSELIADPIAFIVRLIL
jgi:hypothetical protein